MSKYKCKKCGWEGEYDDVDKDIVDTCMGSDEVEICPKCGNIVYVIIDKDQLE